MRQLEPDVSQPSPPLPRFELQSIQPESHTSAPHEPPVQVLVAWGSVGQRTRHPPQWFSSLLRFASQPLAGEKSQSW